jgi:ribosomal protein S10
MKFNNTIQLTISSYTIQNLNQFFQFFNFCLKQNKLNLKITKFNLPKKIYKLTLLKSPFIYKTARTQIESRTSKQVIQISNFNINQLKKLKIIINFFIKNLPTGIKLKIKEKKLLFI